MIDVYFCSAPIAQERQQIAEKMLAWWLDVDGLRVHVLTPRTVDCSLEQFNRKRRIHAEYDSDTSLYILTDDDCELESPEMIWKGLETLNVQPNFGILSAWPKNAQINRWTPEMYTPYEDLSVTEHISVGGLRFMRRGAMKKGWPEMTGLGYDAEHCWAMRMSGYRCGYLQHCRMTHHGEGKTELWKAVFPVLSKSS
jgi:GT2 family glycosyltransferase